MKDWKGNTKSVYITLGASNHVLDERELNDFYATDPIAIDLLLSEEVFEGEILEPACGQGHLSERLRELGHTVHSSDLINRGYGEVKDFFELTLFDGNIITNPPYKYAKEFIEHSLRILPEGKKIAMFLKLQFLEGKSRKTLFLKNPPKTLYVSSSRIACAKGGDFEKVKGSAVAYGWYVWEVGFKGTTEVKWIN